MFANIFKNSAVICLAFSSMVQMLVLPQTTIVEEMRSELRNCSFPPAEVLKDSHGGIFSLCEVTRPILLDGKPSAYDLNFAFGKYLCMELFDLSLQLCGKNVSKVELPLSEDDLSKYSMDQNVTSFCGNLQFSSSHSKITSQWAGIAIETLKNRTLCENNCIKQNYLNPVCGAISLANKLLMMVSEKQTAEKFDSQVAGHVAEVQTSPEHENSILKAELASQPITKEEVVTKVTNTNGAKMESKAVSITANGILGSPSNQDSFKKESVTNSIGTAVVKNITAVNLTQQAPGTSTVINELANVNVDKDDDREEDHIHPSRMDVGDSPGIEDSRIPSDDEIVGLGSKEMGQDSFPDEGVAEEDTQPRSNTANELHIESRVYQDTFVDAQDSHFFAYFLTMVVICIVGYLLFHNKQKIIALALEGRRMQGSRRRPNTSSYKKLDSNLEEAVTSTCSSSSVTHVIF